MSVGVESGLPWSREPSGTEEVRESVEVKLLAEDGELYILAQSRARVLKERGMRQRRLKKLWRRLHELRRQSLKRDELLLKLGAARKEAGRAWHWVEIRLPEADEAVTPDAFTFALRRDRLRQARRREGRYLLRSNLTGEDPAPERHRIATPSAAGVGLRRILDRTAGRKRHPDFPAALEGG